MGRWSYASRLGAHNCRMLSPSPPVPVRLRASTDAAGLDRPTSTPPRGVRGARVLAIELRLAELAISMDAPAAMEADAAAGVAVRDKGVASRAARSASLIFIPSLKDSAFMAAECRLPATLRRCCSTRMTRRLTASARRARSPA
jgi:hypothetical protein